MTAVVSSLLTYDDMERKVRRNEDRKSLNLPASSKASPNRDDSLSPISRYCSPRSPELPKSKDERTAVVGGATTPGAFSPRGSANESTTKHSGTPPSPRPFRVTNRANHKDRIASIENKYGLVGLSSANYVPISEIKFLIEGKSVLLGEGSQGATYSSLYNGKRCAIKVGVAPIILAEHLLLRSFNHPNIVQTFGFSLATNVELINAGVPLELSSRPKSLYYVAIYEFCKHRDLKSYLKRNDTLRKDVNFLVGIFSDIVDGMEAIHSRLLLHCDIKPDNVLIDRNGRAKLADFGLCQRVEPGMAAQGTPSYLSPETIMDYLTQRQDSLFTDKSDIFSFGVLVAHCVTGLYPFRRITAKLRNAQALSAIDMEKHFKATEEVLRRLVEVDDSRFLNLTKACLRFKPRERCSLSEIRSMLICSLVTERPSAIVRRPRSNSVNF